LDIAKLTQDEAREIYHRDYWLPCKGNDLPRAYAIAVFDCAVNQGPRIAARILQISLGVTVDGVLGPKTIAAAHAAKPRTLRLMLAERLSAYVRLMAEHPKLIGFARNWSFRVLSLAKMVDV
jgi:lysozyme family protein